MLKKKFLFKVFIVFICVLFSQGLHAKTKQVTLQDKVEALLGGDGFDMCVIQTNKPISYQVTSSLYELKVLGGQKVFFSYSHDGIATNAFGAKELAENAVRNHPNVIVALGQHASNAAIAANVVEKAPIIYVALKNTVIRNMDCQIGILVCDEFPDKNTLTNRIIEIMKRLASGVNPKDIKTVCLKEPLD